MQSIFTYKNISVGYHCTGEGPAVVLLHGFLENRFMWSALSKNLARSYRVVCIDLLGHGETGNLGYIHSMEDQAYMVKAVLDHLRLRRYTLIGHSMGGYIALAFAKLFNSTMKGLCLMNSTALPDSDEKKKNRDRAILAVRQNYKTFVKLAIPQLFAEYNRSVYKKEIKELIDSSLSMEPQGIVAALLGMKNRQDNTSIYKNVQYPMLLIAGKRDPALEYDSLVNQVKNTTVKFVSFPDGHMSHIENRAALFTAISSFIRRYS